MAKPNIVFIMAGDMGYGDLGCYGATKVLTPNIDRVAAEGMRFTDAHASSAVYTPSLTTSSALWAPWICLPTASSRTTALRVS